MNFFKRKIINNYIEGIDINKSYFVINKNKEIIKTKMERFGIEYYNNFLTIYIIFSKEITLFGHDRYYDYSLKQFPFSYNYYRIKISLYDIVDIWLKLNEHYIYKTGIEANNGLNEYLQKEAEKHINEMKEL